MNQACPTTSLPLLKALYHASPLATLIFDCQVKVTLWNPAAERLFGWCRDEVLGQTRLSPGEEDFAELQDYLRRALDGESIQSQEIRRRRQDGTLCILSLSSAPLRDETEAITGVLALLEDITARKLDEQKLAESENSYRHLFETMIQGVVCQDAAGRIFSANPAAEKILGLSFAQMQGRTSCDPRWKTIRKDGSDFPMEEHASVIALREGREVRNVVMGIYNPMEDDYRWINIHAMPQFQNDAKTPTEVYSTFEDITARYRAEQELRASEQRFHNLFMGAPDGMYLVDLQGTFLDINAAAEEISGYRRDDLIGRTFFERDLLEPQELATAASNLLRSAQGEATGPDDFLLRRKDGTTVPIEIRTIPLQVGKQVEILGIARDISQRKEVEKQLKEWSQLLEATLSSLDDAIFVISPENRRILSANRAVEQIFGYSAAEVIGRDTAFLHADRSAFDEWGSKGHPELDRTESFRSEWPMKRRDGTLFWAEITVRAINPECGWSRGVVSVVRDISERKRGEEALRRSEQKYRLLSEEFRTLLDGIPESIMLLDPELRIIWSPRNRRQPGA